MAERAAVMTAAFAKRDQLYGYALRLTKDATAAEDLVADAIERAGRGAHGFREGTNLYAWLCTITRNTYINSYRASKRQAERFGVPLSLDEVDDDRNRKTLSRTHRFVDRLEPSVEDVVLNTFSDERLVAAIHELPESWQKMLQLIDVEGRPYKEAAAELGVPVGTVMSGLHRARKRLAEVVWNQTMPSHNAPTAKSA